MSNMDLKCPVCGAKAIMVAGRPLCTKCNMDTGESFVKEIEGFMADLSEQKVEQ